MFSGKKQQFYRKKGRFVKSYMMQRGKKVCSMNSHYADSTSSYEQWKCQLLPSI